MKRSTDPVKPAFPLIAILCYHDISDDPEAKLQTVSPEFLRHQIRACKASGWTFMSLEELLSHRDHPAELPARVMVLTFDDGYRSFIHEALPILREESVKATLAVISSFVDHPPADLPALMSWEQIRRCEQSGLVEVASHTHALHGYATSNPYRDTYPSVNTRRYLLTEARYENREEYRSRIRKDFEESQALIKSKLGHDASVMVWPFGEYNSMARAIAHDAGFTTSLTLGWREVRAEDLRSGVLPRIMVTQNMNITGDDLIWLREPRTVVRAAQVDLDSIYDADPQIFVRNVDQLVKRVRAIGATHVFLQACPDPTGNGFIRQTYFQNHQLPTKADIWSMVANKLNHARLKVWVRAPAMNLSWLWDQHPEWRIPYQPGHSRDEQPPRYFRLSPNLPEARRAAIDFFSDIAVYLPIDGVLFDDDLYMLPGESLNGSLARDAGSKAEAMGSLIEDIKTAVREWRPECQFGRTVYAPVVDRKGVDPRFGQDFDQCLKDYDLTVVAADADRAGHRQDAERWVGTLARKALRRWRPSPDDIKPAPILIELQACNRNTKEWIGDKELMGQVAEASRAGAVQLGINPVTPGRGDLPNGLLEVTAWTPRDETLVK